MLLRNKRNRFKNAILWQQENCLSSQKGKKANLIWCLIHGDIKSLSSIYMRRRQDENCSKWLLKTVFFNSKLHLFCCVIFPYIIHFFQCFSIEWIKFLKSIGTFAKYSTYRSYLHLIWSKICCSLKCLWISE